MRRVLGLGWRAWLYVVAMASVALAHLAFATTGAVYLLLLALGLPLSLASHAMLFMTALFLDSVSSSKVPWAYASTLLVIWWTVTAWLNALLYRGVIENVRKRRCRDGSIGSARRT